ncbi:MAG: NADPH-dependent FMN reductase [Alphaproteobacteria bacterium]
MKFFALAASHRTGSLNRLLVSQVADMVRAAGHTVVQEDYAALDMPLYNDEQSSENHIHNTPNIFADRADAVDGLLVASPEYNWSYPGTLKNIIDWTSRRAPCPLAGKTVLLLSATPSGRGGINGLVHLRTPFESLQAVVFPRVFPLGHADRMLAEGTLQDERQHHILTHIVKDYLEFTRKLRS